MDALGKKKIAVSCVSPIKIMCRRKLLQFGFNGGNDSWVLCDSRKSGLVIGDLTDFLDRKSAGSNMPDDCADRGLK